MDKEKQTGYYWIKLNTSKDTDIIGFYDANNQHWLICGTNAIIVPYYINWTKLINFTGKRIWKNKIIQEKLETLRVGASFNKSEFIQSLYGNDDFFNIRSFDAIMSSIKKNKLSHMEFGTKHGRIIRKK